MSLSHNREVLTAALAAAVFVLAGCGSSYQDTPAPSSVPASSTVDTTEQPSPIEPVEVTSQVATPPPYDRLASPISPTKSSSGANAAPAAQFYNSSEQAKQTYYDWWVYEVQVPQDHRDFRTIYIDGIGVCAARARGAGVTAIETTWSTELGYTKSGASAILKAALVALCPQYDLGYMTYFDRNVQAFATNASKYITFGRTDIQLYEFGAFMKENCASLGVARIGGTGIVDQMGGLVAHNYFTLVNGSVDMTVVYILINEATNAGCTAYTTWLPPVVQMSS